MGGQDPRDGFRQDAPEHPEKVHEGRVSWNRFAAEADYADSMLRSAMGDQEACVAALRRSLDADPTFPATVLALGSVEYQLGNTGEGRRLLTFLPDLDDDDHDLHEVIDLAGDFLIGIEAYADGLKVYRRGVDRFPDVPVLHQGRGCCAGHQGLHDEAIDASRAALALEPDNQQFVNDLGWSLFEAGRLEEAREHLERATAMDPADGLARENLKLCREALEGRRDGP